jgi:F-type H+-transporting ATPase subunit delta
MAELHTMARPYARALFELAVENQSASGWSSLLDGLSMATADPQIAAWLDNPALTREQLSETLVAGLGKDAFAEGGNFIRLLVENGRLKLLPEITSEFKRLLADAGRRVAVEITTAADVDLAQKKVLLEAIGKRLAREVDVSWSVDASLIGGAVIRADDLVIDASVSGELDRLRTILAA